MTVKAANDFEGINDHELRISGGRSGPADDVASGDANDSHPHRARGNRLYDDPRFNWLFESEPEAELGGHRTFQPRGKVLGGTGSINGMI